MNDRMQRSGCTDTVTRDNSLKVPFCDGFDVLLHSPGRSKWVGSCGWCEVVAYSMSLQPAHTSRLCAYDHGFRTLLVKIEKVTLWDFEYCFGRE